MGNRPRICRFRETRGVVEREREGESLMVILWIEVILIGL